jgi:nucleoside-diphosphate-sugar epimerase
MAPGVSSTASVKARLKRKTKQSETSDSQRILVIGGTQFIGRRLVTELLHAGHQIYLLHRKAEHPFGKRVHNLVADRNNPASLREAILNLHFDTVFDFAYDWERGTSGAQVEATAQIFESRRVRRYVFMSSVAAYGDGLNHHEGDALAPDDHPNPYVRNKAMSERALFRMHQRSGFPVVTLRPPFVYGPGNPYYREAFFWDRFRAERSIILPSDGHRLMQFVYVKDLVSLAVKVMEQRNAVGHAFNAANPRAITQHELLGDLAGAAGIEEPRFVSIPREWIQRAGGQVMGRERRYFGEYYDVPAITQVITKAQRMLAFKPTDFATGLRETYRAYLKDHPDPKINCAFEDQLIARFSQQQAGMRSA